MARKNNWPHRRPINLFENTYRFGSLVFGGGQVLIPFMYEQFVARPGITKRLTPAKFVLLRNPNAIHINKDDFYHRRRFCTRHTRSGFFRFIVYGRNRHAGYGFSMQILGCVIGSIAIFLPSALLVLFFFPIWSNLKKYATVYRALEGIKAVVVGIMIASSFYMIKDFTPGSNLEVFAGIGVGILTFMLLLYSRLPSPVIVTICLLLGWIF